MKQHITIEQLNELSKKGKRKFSSWCQKKFDLNKDEAKRLSIGEMIEFLSEQKVYSNDFKEQVKVNRLVCDRTNSKIHIGWNDIELCDALWKAVKEVLGR